MVPCIRSLFLESGMPKSAACISASDVGVYTVRATAALEGKGPTSAEASTGLA